MASLDDVVSNLKNVVTNLSGLSTGTTLVNSISTLTISINAIGSTLTSALLTPLSFGGQFTWPNGAGTVVVTNTSVVSGAYITVFQANASAYLMTLSNGIFLNGVSNGSFALSTDSGTAASGGSVFNYVGYNP